MESTYIVSAEFLRKLLENVRYIEMNSIADVRSKAFESRRMLEQIRVTV